MKLRITTNGEFFRVEMRVPATWYKYSWMQLGKHGEILVGREAGNLSEYERSMASFASYDEARSAVNEWFGTLGLKSVQDKEWRPV